MQADELLSVPITEDLDANAPNYLEHFNRSIPRKLYGSIEHWLEAHSDGPTDFRTATAPLGMTMRWIERAEQAEAELASIRRTSSNYREFDKAYDQESTLPELAQRVYDDYCELLNRIDALKSQIKVRDNRSGATPK